ncbi:MAG: SGNH/GDSL hydrolase family protein [Roseivirga sp.]|nr:SGNH/GDSL hydrolase family protein [Roseivirga sp.]
MKKRLFTLLISTVIFVILLFGTEFLLGPLSEQTPKEFVPQRHIFLKENTPGTSRTHDQPVTYFTGGESNGESRKVRFEVDKRGYVEPSNLLKNPDATIAFMGGSTTECWAVAEEKRFPYLVGQLFNRHGFKVNTLNAAVAGNNSAHTLNIYLNKVLIEESDIAVMMHNINDFMSSSEVSHIGRSMGVLHKLSPKSSSLQQHLPLKPSLSFPT